MDASLLPLHVVMHQGRIPSSERTSSGTARAQPDTETMKDSTAPAVDQQRLVRCQCAACITIEDPEMVHWIPAPPEYKQPELPPEGTLARAIWDARGGPPPAPPQRGFA